jgi:hypothetical protein
MDIDSLKFHIPWFLLPLGEIWNPVRGNCFVRIQHGLTNTEEENGSGELGAVDPHLVRLGAARPKFSGTNVKVNVIIVPFKTQKGLKYLAY